MAYDNIILKEKWREYSRNYEKLGGQMKMRKEVRVVYNIRCYDLGYITKNAIVNALKKTLYLLIESEYSISRDD